jgi:hypothetical protein
LHQAADAEDPTRRHPVGVIDDIGGAVEEQDIVLQCEDREAGSAAAGKKKRYREGKTPLLSGVHISDPDRFIG